MTVDDVKTELTVRDCRILGHCSQFGAIAEDPLWQFYALENDNTNCVTDMKDTSNKVELVPCLRN